MRGVPTSGRLTGWCTATESTRRGCKVEAETGGGRGAERGIGWCECVCDALRGGGRCWERVATFLLLHCSLPPRFTA